MNLLEKQKKISVIVADTGDIDAIARLRPQDATTNPSALSAGKPEVPTLVDASPRHARRAIERAKPRMMKARGEFRRGISSMSKAASRPRSTPFCHLMSMAAWLRRAT